MQKEKQAPVLITPSFTMEEYRLAERARIQSLLCNEVVKGGSVVAKSVVPAKPRMKNGVQVMAQDGVTPLFYDAKYSLQLAYDGLVEELIINEQIFNAVFPGEFCKLIGKAEEVFSFGEKIVANVFHTVEV